jgi:hypothetical protein
LMLQDGISIPCSAPWKRIEVELALIFTPT